MDQIRQLQALINNAIDTLDKTCTKNGTKIPSLSEPFHPASEAFREDPAAAQATMLIGAAALQLAATVLPPPLSMFNLISGHQQSAAVRTALESSVTEVLREAGPEGLHVDVIAEKTGIDAQKIGRCLRTLTIRHVYREIKPDVFTNTRISTVLDTLKPSQDIIADPTNKHVNTFGTAAMAGHQLDEVFKSAAYLWESLSDPVTGKSGEPEHAPFGKVLSNGKPFYDFFAEPDQVIRQKRFDVGMRAVNSMVSSSSFLQAYDWKSLPDGSLVVDVGGGVGTVPMVLVKAHPNLRVVVQDQPAVVESGKQIWETEMPDALKSGRVKFEVHDFFEPQPQKGASIFLLKHVVHNWSDEYAIKILKQLRASTMPNTKIICLEGIIPYGCRVATEPNLIPGAAPVEAPEPLLPHWGLVSAMYNYLDMTMMILTNSQERTIGQFERVFEAAGWKIVNVRRPTGRDSMTLAALEAVPI